MNKNIALVGFMGSGKTAVSKKLAAFLKRDFISTDEIIVEREKRSISDIFKDSGERYFRDLEKSVINEVSQKNNLVIDCGGGIVLQKENIDRLKQNGLIFYLRATPEVILERTKGQGHRPLLNVPDPKQKIKELLRERENYYRQADLTIETSNRSIDSVVQEILKVLEEHDRT